MEEEPINSLVEEEEPVVETPFLEEEQEEESVVETPSLEEEEPVVNAPSLEEPDDISVEDITSNLESSPIPVSSPIMELEFQYEDIYSESSSPLPQKTQEIYNVPKVVFIIPYRNRESHKSKLLEKMKVILEDYHPSYYKIIFVHQADTRSFNRGAVKNIGFMYVKHLYPAEYRTITFVFNDVDTFPKEKNIIPTYETKSSVIKHFYGFTYALGGIFSIQGEDFEKINGFPNYWTWGFEDNTIQKRALKQNIKIDRDIFYTFGDTRIIQLNDENTRVVNHSEFDRYLLAINEGIKSITSVNSIPEELDNTNSVIMLNVYNFNTGTQENKERSFETSRLNQPFGGRHRADIFRMKFT